MRDVPVWRDERVERVVEMFREVGCDDLRSEKILGSPTPNVICTLEGKTDRTIVVGSHHVVAKGGKGVIDDWSGTVMLPTLYASMKGRPRDHTYEFIAFASSSYAGDASYMHLRDMDSRERNRVVAMIWLDLLGMGNMAAWTARSDPNLWADLTSVARALEVEVEARDLSGAGMIHDHSRAFRWFDIPTIFLHSVDLETQKVLRDPHFDNDPESLDYDAYFDSYRVLAVYLGYLDHTLVARRM